MSTLTMVHVGLSLIGIAAGFLVIFQMIGGKTLGGFKWCVFDDDDSDQRDGILFSDYEGDAGIGDWRDFAGGAGDCVVCRVFEEAGGRLACGVCRDGGDRAVLQRAGADCAVRYEDFACYTRWRRRVRKRLSRSRRFVRWCCASCLELSREEVQRPRRSESWQGIPSPIEAKRASPHGRTCGVCFGFSGAWRD